MKRTYVFPGQGAQKVGMGEQLFDEFADLTRKADKILGYSIKELCLKDPNNELNQTQFTQPALYVVNALSYQKKIKEDKTKPSYLAGHSLGEYNALQAAGIISFEDGLKLVKKRGELMSQAKNGGMAAVLNSSEEDIKAILKNAKLTTIDLANMNSPTQIVISGIKDDINKAQPFFEKANTMFIPLNTSGAFHSRYMKEAEKEFAKVVNETKFSKPKIPVIANVTGKPYEADKMAENLVKQISNCVRWTDSINYLLDENNGEIEFEELGVGDVLTKLVKAIQRAYKPSAKKAVAPTKSKTASATEKTAATKAKSTKTETKAVKAKAESKSPKTKVASNVSESVPVNSQEMVEQWNKQHPIGTKVTSELYDTELETRTEAMLLFGHRAAVYMKDYNGYFDLREVNPVG